MISKHGETVTVKPRSVSVDEYGNPTYTFEPSDEFTATALVYEARGWTEDHEIIGYRDNVDYVVLLHADYSSSVSPHDIVELEDGTELLVASIITRRRASRIEFLELLCRRNV